MTQPTPPPQQVQPVLSATSQQDAKTIAAIAALLTVGAGVAATTPHIAALLAIHKISSAAAGAAVKLAMRTPPVQPGRGGPTPRGGGVSARRLTANLEPQYRAAYILNAARRIDADLRAGYGAEAAIGRETRWYQQHLKAQANRASRAGAVDAAARRHGAMLGWYSTIDGRTTPECRAANGKNFQVDKVPPIGYPGTVHMNCRCRPGPPHRTSQTVYSIKPDTRRKAANS